MINYFDLTKLNFGFTGGAPDLNEVNNQMVESWVPYFGCVNQVSGCVVL